MMLFKLSRECAIAAVLSTVTGINAGLSAPSLSAPPVATASPAQDAYPGETLTDNYRWMEGDPSPDLLAYLSASATYAEGTISRVKGRAGLLADLDALSQPYVTVSNVTQDGDTLFYLKRGPDEAEARLTQRGGESGEEHVLLDPQTLADAPPNSEIVQISPSQDGSFVAYTMQDQGPESAVLRIYDAVHGTTLPERIQGARYAPPAWLPDGTGFYYTRPVDRAGSSRRAAGLGVFLHLLRTNPAHDRKVLDAARLTSDVHAATGVPRIVLPPASDYALALLSGGVGDPIAVYTLPQAQVVAGSAPWQPLAEPADGVTQVSVSGALAFLLTRDKTPAGRVVSEDLADPGFSTARTILPAGESVITSIAAASDALYAARRRGADTDLIRLDYNQAEPERVRLPFAGVIAPPNGDSGGLTADDSPGGLTADPRAAGVFLSLESWMHPRTWLHYDLRLHRVVDPSVVPEFTRDVSAYQAQPALAVAADGFHVPMVLISRRDVARDHARPMLLEASGRHDLDAHFVPAALAWADQGGIYAVANIRGDEDPRPGAHPAAQMPAIADGVSDLIACADTLVAQGYTSPGKIAAAGSHAGALVVSGAMVRKPDLFRAVLLRDGWVNPLRSNEYTGKTVSFESRRFSALRAIDAYQNIKNATPYPAVLLAGQPADAQVPAWQSAKMAARLQAASDSGRPVLLRIKQGAVRTNPAEAVARTADELAFLLWQLDIPEFAEAPASPPRGAHARRRPRK